MELKSNKRWIYLDVLKILSMFFIVVTNTAAACWSLAPAGSPDWWILTFFNSMSRFSVPLFFMLSGASLLSPEKELTPSTIWKKHILPLVTAFFFWSIIYVLFSYSMDAPEKLASFDAYGFIKDVLAGDPYRHWFIMLIISVLIVLPALRAIAKDQVGMKNFLVM